MPQHAAESLHRAPFHETHHGLPMVAAQHVPVAQQLLVMATRHKKRVTEIARLEKKLGPVSTANIAAATAASPA